ncbi:MAG: MarR family transcriptional regulator [Desulfobacterales bacterium]|nr:MarR family transcriptional regulator [Desulfobacterales bacterium]
MRITTVQGMLLMFLVDKDNITSAELGKRVKLDSATLTGLINRLESLELVERRKDREDRRAVRICLTPSGRDLGMRVTEITAKAHHEFLSGQKPESEQQLIHLIDQLSDRGN